MNQESTMNTTETNVQVADKSSAAPITSAEVLALRTLDGAEMIYVGGGYCAADY